MLDLGSLSDCRHISKNARNGQLIFLDIRECGHLSILENMCTQIWEVSELYVGDLGMLQL